MVLEKKQGDTMLLRFLFITLFPLLCFASHQKISRKEIEKYKRASQEDLKYYAIQNGKVIGSGILVPMLVALQKKRPLPDLEFLYYEGPLLTPPKALLPSKFPIFSRSRAKNTKGVILLPFTLGEKKEPSCLPWESRPLKVLVKHSDSITPYIKEHPDLIDLNPSHIENKYYLDPKWQLLSFEEQKCHLLSGSLLFLTHLEIETWLSSYLKPWVHYVPVKTGLSDFMYQIGWALSYDSKAKEIAKNAVALASDDLNEKLLYNSVYEIFAEYAALLDN